MWPSEGSVCQALIPLLAEHGIEWIATDEEILGCSTGGRVGRDSRGHVRHPELLYRAWKVQEAGRELAIVFRDHSMSDQVGFHYQRSPGPVAAADFLGKLARDRRRLPAQPGHARPGHSRRRELLGVLPGRRRVVPPFALPDAPPAAARSGRSRSASSSANIPRPIPCPTCSPGAGSATTSPSGSAIPRTTGAGTRCTPPGRFSSRKNAPAGTIRPRSGEGLGRALYRPGLRLVLVVWRRSFECSRRPVRPPVPQAPAQHLHPAGLRPAGLAVHADLASGRPSSDPRPADELLERQGRRDAPPTSSGSTRPATSAATTGGR